jgi:hypothetical protein
MWLFASHDPPYLALISQTAPKRRLAFDDKRNDPIVNCYIAVKERPELWSE